MSVAAVPGPVNPAQLAYALAPSAPHGGGVYANSDGTWTVDYIDLTADEIRATAATVTYDPTWVAPTTVNADAITQRLLAALTANNSYLAITSPTTAQAVSYTKTVAKELNGVIRLLLNQLDSTSGT